MAHYLFDTLYSELVDHMGGAPVAYATCEEHAHHDEAGRYVCVAQPVYGPDRREAATRAVRALAQAVVAHNEAPMFSDWSRPRHIELALIRARVERSWYSEYGDSYAAA